MFVKLKENEKINTDHIRGVKMEGELNIWITWSDGNREIISFKSTDERDIVYNEIK